MHILTDYIFVDASAVANNISCVLLRIINSTIFKFNLSLSCTQLDSHEKLQVFLKINITRVNKSFGMLKWAKIFF